jgi:hypothetical protein
MNSYSVSSMFNTGSTSANQMGLLYAFVPLLVGAVIDVLFTQMMGAQYCSLNSNSEYVCSIRGVKFPQWEREFIRTVLQFGLIMCAIIFLVNNNGLLLAPLHTSLFGLSGIVMFWLAQPDLFSDFRRLCNGLVFTVKYI